MIQYTTEQLATTITVPIVSILLLWTIAIFHKNRKQWGPYDIPIVAILTLSVLRNLTIFSYTLIIVLNQTLINLEYCSVVVWIFNSVHTFQASSLTTLAVVGLFAAKLYRKQQNLKQFLTATHVIYHLFCLTTLCACVGVAAILAQHNPSRDYLNGYADYGIYQNPCKFMPYQLDIKFNVFIIVLHIFLAIVSVVTFILICYHHYKAKISSFDYLKKSTSDLSDLSLGMSATFTGPKDSKNYYDTYTIQRGENYYEQNGYCNNQGVWNSDVSNISATVSSTNSRRPCLMRQVQQEEEEMRTGLETIHPVLIVCYLFYHLPLIGLCIFPKIIAPWPVAGAALWLGLLQDILIPTGLGLVDTRFCKWVTDVYRCSNSHQNDKLPQVGLDGRFRHFGSQPQSLEVIQPLQERNTRVFQPNEHKFPITNGSLYTSIDGRVPVIHNYRRQHKDHRGARSLEAQSLNLGIHSTHLRRQNSRENFLETPYPKQKYCGNCEADLCSSGSNLHHLAPTNRHFDYVNNNNLLIKRVSLSQNSIAPPTNTKTERKPILRKDILRLSKSEDSLNNVHKDLKTFKKNPEIFQKIQKQTNTDYTSSEEEYFTDSIHDRTKNFDSISLESSYSITTEANCDFEFFRNKKGIDFKHHQDNNIICMHVKAPSLTNTLTSTKPSMETFKPQKPEIIDKNFKITRSNSKRSLENFKMFVSEVQIQRSNSHTTLEKRKKCEIGRSNSELSENNRKMNKSAEVLNQPGGSVVYISDCRVGSSGNQCKMAQYGGSVPDFKKVFITEYI